MRPVIHSVKHYRQIPINQIATGVLESTVLVAAVESTVANTNQEVAEGTLVKAIYVELWLQNQGNLGEFIATLTKVPEAGTGPTFAEHANLFSYTNKKNILYTTQGLTPNDAISGPIAVMRQWFKIPKTKQRFGLGDRVILSISNVSSQDLNRCGLSIYKEYS